MIVKGISLSTELKSIIEKIEKISGNKVVIKNIDGFNIGQSKWEDKVPVIFLSDIDCEEIIAHEILHLYLRVIGFPNRLVPHFPPNYTPDIKLELLLEHYDNFLQHYIIFHKFCAMGYYRNKFIRPRNLDTFYEDVISGIFSNKEPCKKQHLIYHFFAINSEFHCYLKNRVDEVNKKVIPLLGEKLLKKFRKITNNLAYIKGKDYCSKVQGVFNLIGYKKVSIEPIYINFT